MKARTQIIIAEITAVFVVLLSLLLMSFMRVAYISMILFYLSLIILSMAYFAAFFTKKLRLAKIIRVLWFAFLLWPAWLVLFITVQLSSILSIDFLQVMFFIAVPFVLVTFLFGMGLRGLKQMVEPKDDQKQ